MPTIAQKLCRDLVEPRVKSSEDNVKKRSSVKFSSNKYNTKLPHTGYISKTKNSKIESPHTSGSSLKERKSGVTVLKSNIADSAINTLVSGPLRCDNNCITSIRKRNHQGTCKCGQNRKPKVSAKEIQTLSKIIYPLSDKACTQCVETVTCGTQFIDNKGRILKQVDIIDKRLAEQCVKYEPDFDKFKCLRKYSNTDPSVSTISRPSLRYISAKRWALTNYPTRGPDF